MVAFLSVWLERFSTLQVTFPKFDFDFFPGVFSFRESLKDVSFPGGCFGYDLWSASVIAE